MCVVLFYGLRGAGFFLFYTYDASGFFNTHLTTWNMYINCSKEKERYLSQKGL